MNAKIQIQLVRSIDGLRHLRGSEKAAGLCLETRLNACAPVARQKARLLREFEDLLPREAAAVSH